MDWIEQAVFTSAETDRSAGYQLVATSPGVCEEDAREMAVWGPSHDALSDSTPAAVSVNFHPLPSGNFCVSRTAPAGFEYSGRGGPRVYTQLLIVSPEVLARFANNPFALLRAALAGGWLRLHAQVPKELERLRLAGRAAALDSALLSRLSASPGPDWLATLVQAALGSTSVAVVGGPPAEHLIAGLINCLPPECRTEFSFSTGLKHSARRPFRVIALTADADERRRVERLYHVAVLDLSGPPPAELAPIDSWPRLIQRVLKTGRTSLLDAQFSRRQGELALNDLPALGLQLLEEFEATALDGNARPAQPADPPFCEEDSSPDAPVPPPRALPQPLPADLPSPDVSPPGERRRPSRQARRRLISKGRPAAPSLQTTPSSSIQPEDRRVLEKLERLDDLVFDAIAGKDTALDELQAFWPRVREELGENTIDESREQYLRYALSIWERFIETETVGNPARAVRSLEVLCLLFEGA
ncbi:MAG: GAP1-N2 domain-containing protein [Planctomycetota bacterium]|jgi:hypothetical protein